MSVVSESIQPPATDTDLTIHMGAEFDSPLPGETFKSVHNLTPWQMGIGRNPMNTAAVKRADEREHEAE